MLNKHKKIITLILVLLLSQVGLIYILLDSGNQNLLQSIEKIKLPGKDKNSLLARIVKATTKEAPIMGRVIPVMLIPQAFIAVNSLFLASEAKVITVARRTP